MFFNGAFCGGLIQLKITRKKINDLREKVGEYDWTGISFPTMVKEIKNFERRNNVSVNVYYRDKCVKPLKTVEEEKDTHVDLFLLKDEEQEKEDENEKKRLG